MHQGLMITKPYPLNTRADPVEKELNNKLPQDGSSQKWGDEHEPLGNVI